MSSMLDNKNDALSDTYVDLGDIMQRVSAKIYEGKFYLNNRLLSYFTYCALELNEIVESLSSQTPATKAIQLGNKESTLSDFVNYISITNNNTLVSVCCSTHSIIH